MGFAFSIIAIVFFGIYFFVFRKYDEITSPWTVIATVLSLSIIAIFLLMISDTYPLYTGKNQLRMDVTGQVGDFIGGVVGTIVAGISVILLYNTFVEQKAFSRDQTKYLKKNETAQKDQQFENTFFQLLNTHNTIKQSIQFNTKDRLTWWTEEGQEQTRIVIGSEFFEFAKWDFHRLYQPEGQIYPAITVKHDNILEGLLPNPSVNYEANQPVERIKQKYKKFFDTYHPYLGHYFRNVYYLLKYIEKHEVFDMSQEGSDRNKIAEKYKLYVGILQSQMSSSEQFLLFYNGLCYPKMKNLILKYNMLENLSKEDLADSERHYNLYEGIELKTRYSIINDNRNTE